MDQRSSEWHEKRRRMITASNFAKVLAGKDTKRRLTYLNELRGALAGVPDFEDHEDIKPWFAHGTAWEDEAKGAYEFDHEVDVESVGLIVHPDYDFISCSPDGLVADDGGIEIKCYKSIREYMKVAEKGLPSVHRAQVQGCLWVTGRDWWDFIAYYKGESNRMAVFRQTPDEEYQEKLEQACLEFWNEVTEVTL